tara:strand:+ start:904 stop:1293 length:390 start_codon:yes stop_codon:yes gene_type:complete
MMYQLKSCLKCHGDLAQYEDEWRCLQCGRYYYLPPTQESAPSQAEPDLVTAHVPEQEHSRRRPGGMAGNNPNRFIQNQESKNKEWQARNRVVISYLDRGFKVAKNAQLTGSSPRNIRSVRERLTELAVN